jgi:hypothetical protein
MTLPSPAGTPVYRTPFRWDAGRILDANGQLVAQYQPAPGAPESTGDIVAARLSEHWEEHGLAAPVPETTVQRWFRWFCCAFALVLSVVLLANYFWAFLPEAKT